MTGEHCCVQGATIIFRPWDESESEVEEKFMMEPKNTTLPIYLKHQGA